jgi:hypothetical protein
MALSTLNYEMGGKLQNIIVRKNIKIQELTGKVIAVDESLNLPLL